MFLAKLLLMVIMTIYGAFSISINDAILNTTVELNTIRTIKKSMYKRFEEINNILELKKTSLLLLRSIKSPEDKNEPTEGTDGGEGNIVSAEDKEIEEQEMKIIERLKNDKLILELEIENILNYEISLQDRKLELIHELNVEKLLNEEDKMNNNRLLPTPEPDYDESNNNIDGNVDGNDVKGMKSFNPFDKNIISLLEVLEEIKNIMNANGENSRVENIDEIDNSDTKDGKDNNSNNDNNKDKQDKKYNEDDKEEILMGDRIGVEEIVVRDNNDKEEENESIDNIERIKETINIDTYKDKEELIVKKMKKMKVIKGFGRMKKTSRKKMKIIKEVGRTNKKLRGWLSKSESDLMSIVGHGESSDNSSTRGLRGDISKVDNSNNSIENNKENSNSSDSSSSVNTVIDNSNNKDNKENIGNNSKDNNKDKQDKKDNEKKKENEEDEYEKWMKRLELLDEESKYEIIKREKRRGRELYEINRQYIVIDDWFDILKKTEIELHENYMNTQKEINREERKLEELYNKLREINRKKHNNNSNNNKDKQDKKDNEDDKEEITKRTTTTSSSNGDDDDMDIKKEVKELKIQIKNVKKRILELEIRLLEKEDTQIECDYTRDNWYSELRKNQKREDEWLIQYQNIIRSSNMKNMLFDNRHLKDNIKWIEENREKIRKERKEYKRKIDIWELDRIYRVKQDREYKKEDNRILTEEGDKEKQKKDDMIEIINVIKEKDKEKNKHQVEIKQKGTSNSTTSSSINTNDKVIEWKITSSKREEPSKINSSNKKSKDNKKEIKEEVRDDRIRKGIEVVKKKVWWDINENKEDKRNKIKKTEIKHILEVQKEFNDDIEDKKKVEESRINKKLEELYNEHRGKGKGKSKGKGSKIKVQDKENKEDSNDCRVIRKGNINEVMGKGRNEQDGKMDRIYRVKQDKKEDNRILTEEELDEMLAIQLTMEDIENSKLIEGIINSNDIKEIIITSKHKGDNNVDNVKEMKRIIYRNNFEGIKYNKENIGNNSNDNNGEIKQKEINIEDKEKNKNQIEIKQKGTSNGTTSSSSINDMSIMGAYKIEEAEDSDDIDSILNKKEEEWIKEQREELNKFNEEELEKFTELEVDFDEERRRIAKVSQIYYLEEDLKNLRETQIELMGLLRNKKQRKITLEIEICNDELSSEDKIMMNYEIKKIKEEKRKVKQQIKWLEKEEQEIIMKLRYLKI